MQDIHSVGTGTGGGGARLFGGVGGSNGGDRRLRPHNHTHHHAPPAMKCPRCESSNTKFCYYNNYNLSQPRHFCKSCRRYWTKGGVLRNVPVGGGCRKTKRSKSKTNTNSSGVRKSSNSNNSSSDSSTLTEKTTKTTTTTTTNTTSVTTNPVFSFQETNTTGFVTIPNSVNSVNTVTRNPSFEPFPEIPEMGTFTSLITSTTTTTSQISHTPLQFNDISPFRSANQTEWLETEQQTIGEELKVQSPLGGFTEDWNNGTTDQALFDLTVDQSYWNQAHWNEHDQGDDHQLNYLR